MKRKLLISLLSVTCASCCAIGLAACNNGEDPGNINGSGNPGDYPTYVRPEVVEDTKLAYQINEAGTYSITGIGTETKTDIVIPSKIGDIAVTEIADNAFSGKADITSVTISDGITAIGASVFSNCSGLKSIRIPNTVVAVGESLFLNCDGLLTVVLGSGLTGISNSMFESCTNLRTINIPDNITYVGESAFQNCENLNTVNMGSGVLKIGYRAFYGCIGLKSVELGSGVTELGNGVFQNCSALESIVVPNSVRYIGTNLLTGCKNIKTIQVPFVGAFRYQDPPEHLKPNEDEDGENNIPQGTIDINDPTTYGFFGYFVGGSSNYDNNNYTDGIISNVTVIITDDSPITNGSFNNVWGVSTVIIKGNVEVLMQNSFAMCWDLQTMVLPASIKTIDWQAIFSINNLQSVYYEGTVADWGRISIDSTNYAIIGNDRATIYYAGEWNYGPDGMPRAI